MKKSIILYTCIFLLLGSTFSFATHDVQLTYTRVGKIKTVTDTVGLRTFGYNQFLEVESETITGLYDVTIGRNYSTIGGRYIGFNCGPDYEVTYGYDNVGRINSVTWNEAGISRTATYTYLPNSKLISQIQIGDLTTTYSYEPHRDLCTRVQNKFQNRIISQYDYTYDKIKRKTVRLMTGESFADETFNFYFYNARNELTGASQYIGTDTNDTSNPVPEKDRGYQYDPIGNRETSSESTEPKSYTLNELNQFIEIIDETGTTEYQYDDDGNLASISDDSSETKFNWNSENRLISVDPMNPSEGKKKCRV